MSEEWSNTYAELCGVLCLFDEPEQQVARAWAALSAIPRMKPELLVHSPGSQPSCRKH